MRKSFIFLTIVLATIVILTRSYVKTTNHVPFVKQKPSSNVAPAQEHETITSQTHHKLININKPVVHLAKVYPSESTKFKEYLNELVMQMPSARDFEYKSKRDEAVQLILQDQEATKRLFNILSSQKDIESIFGDQQAQARVKLIDFFREAGSVYSDELVTTIKKITKDQSFLANEKGRENDYRDLVTIFFKNINDEEFRNNLPIELRKIEYDPKVRKLVGLALLQSHPDIARQPDFERQILPFIRGEKI